MLSIPTTFSCLLSLHFSLNSRFKWWHCQLFLMVHRPTGQLPLPFQWCTGAISLVTSSAFHTSHLHVWPFYPQDSIYFENKNVIGNCFLILCGHMCICTACGCSSHKPFCALRGHAENALVRKQMHVKWFISDYLCTVPKTLNGTLALCASASMLGRGQDLYCMHVVSSPTLFSKVLSS